MEQHSPTPWGMYINSQDDCARFYDANSRWVATFGSGKGAHDVANRVLRAYAVHDKLVAALREGLLVAIWVEGLRLGGVSVPSEVDNALDSVQFALAQLEGDDGEG